MKRSRDTAVRVAVTGGASGIGAAVARRFLAAGAFVYVMDHDHEGIEGWRHDAPADSLIAQVVDVTDEDSVATVFEDLVGYGLDALVNSAGIVIGGSTEGLSREAWDRTLAVNLTGVWLCSKYAIPAIRRRGGGTIVNIGSTASLVGLPDLAAYAASKGGVAQLTRAMALDLAAEGIRVNCVCPGHINTPLGDRFIDSHDDPAGFRLAFAREHPIGRLGEADEVAEFVHFLCTPSASFITGAVLPIDGGYTAR